MDDQRADPGTRPDPTGDHDVSEPEWADVAATVFPLPLGEQRATGDAHGARRVPHRDAAPTRLPADGRGRSRRATAHPVASPAPHRRVHRPAHLSASSPGLYGASATPRRTSRSSTTPPRMTTAAGHATSPAPPSSLRPRGKYTQQPPTRGSPRQAATAPRGLRQLALDVDQRLGVDRPHMTILSRSPGMARCAVHPVIAPGLLGCELVAHDLENRVHVRQRPNLDDERQHAPCHLGLGCLSSKAVGNRK